jgi:hypothetical protein
VPPDLNNREDAILLWAAGIVGYAVYKDARGIGSAFWGVSRAFVAPKLLLLFASAALYSAGVVYLLARMDLWHTTSLKETIYWFVGTGVVLAGSGTQAKLNKEFVKQIIGKLLRITLVIEFVVNLYVFPLVVEIVLVFLVLAFTGMQVIAKHDPKIQAPTRKIIDGVLLGIGAVLLLTFAVSALSDLDGFFARETAEDFLVVPVLTVALIPFLYVVAWYSRRELDTIRKRFRTDEL